MRTGIANASRRNEVVGKEKKASIFDADAFFLLRRHLR